MSEIAHYLPGILAAYAILLVGSLSPGPAVAMLVGVGTNQGRSSALMATLGIASGSATLNILTLSGVGLLLSQAAWAMQVTNPKAISFWLAIASVNAVSGASLRLILLFVIGGVLVSFTCHGTWAVDMSSKAARRSYAKLRRWIEAFLGGLFTLFAIRLLTTVD